MTGRPAIPGYRPGGGRNGLTQIPYVYRGTKFGTDDDEARQARAERGRRAAQRIGAPPPAHGTYAGYQRHRKEHTPFCEPCRQARREYAARQRAEGRQRAEDARLVPGRRAVLDGAA